MKINITKPTFYETKIIEKPIIFENEGELIY